MSAWIEIAEQQLAEAESDVALLVSAWIEIVPLGATGKERPVALLVSAWIEMIQRISSPNNRKSRTPRECVD